MKPMRERITEYSNGDNLDLFWRLFRLRERSGSRLVTGLHLGPEPHGPAARGLRGENCGD